MFNIPNILTGFNLLAGVTSIIFAFSGRLELAVLAIFIGAFFDFFDGMAARLLNKQSEMGKQLDSLADIITFGVAPGVIVFILLIISGAIELSILRELPLADFWKEGTFGYNIHFWINTYFNDLVNNESPHLTPFFQGWYLYIPFAALFIPFMSLFRLAKFNIDTRQSEHFIGLPTPANSIFFTSFALLLWDGFSAEDWRSALSLTLIKDQVLITFVIVFSVLLVAEFPLFSLKFKSLRFQGNQIRFLFLGISLVLFLAIFVWAIPIIVLLYLIVSVIHNKMTGV